ncbi:MAG: uroporphyrinogen decarboxylase family protein [Clostridia bacterium]|jgi:hypothetical protein
MSYADGWAAMNLEMPQRVPRTEYSASSHWELVKNVTGMNVDAYSPAELQREASLLFQKAWNYDFVWRTHTFYEAFEGYYTKMGHAIYAAGGVDYDDEISCPFKEPEEVLRFDPWDKFGFRDKQKLKEEFEASYEDAVKSYPDGVNMTGIYITCISGLIGIFGWEMLLTAAGLDPKGFGEVTDRYVSWIQQYFEALAEANVPVVMIHDDIVWTSGAIFYPDWYRRYVFPNYRKLFTPLLESGKKIMYTSDGNFTEFIDELVDCGIHGFCLEPTTDMNYIAEKYGKSHVFIGNADTRILLTGSKEDIYNEVKRCMDIGKACPGYFMAVGNHIPPNTPVENALYYNEIYEKLSRR